MNKPFSIAIFVLVVLIVLLFWSDNRKVRKQVEPHWSFWSAAIKEAGDQKLTTDQFIEKYKDYGAVENSPLGGLQLTQHIELSSVFCNAHTLTVFYSSSGGDRARLSMLSSEREGLLCL